MWRMGDKPQISRRGSGAAFAAFGTALAVVFMAVVAALFVVPYAFDLPTQRDEGFLVSIDKNAFPDSAWRSYVQSTFDADRDGYLSRSEAAAVTEIGSYDEESYEVADQGVSHLSIASLKGIEFFPNLTMLVAQGNDIEELDISGNPRLLKIDMRVNPAFDLKYSEQNAEAQVLVNDGAHVVAGGDLS